MKGRIGRRRFMAYGGGGLLALAGWARNRPARAQLPDVFERYTDPETGVRVVMLSHGPEEDDLVYQTHPMWTNGMRHLVFKSDRSTGFMAPHGLDMQTGEVRLLAETEKAPVFSLSWHSDMMVYMDDRTIRQVDVLEAFAQQAQPRRIAELPDTVHALSGTISVNAGETVLYAGVTLEPEARWAIMACDLSNGTWETVVETDFRVGHTQANPHDDRYVLFCHETGGFAPQRMWLLDTQAGSHRPFYESPMREWVTHEVWWGRDRVIYTIWPYSEAQKRRPHGVCWTGLDGEKRHVLSRFPAWHTHGSPDQRWAVADDFDRNIWLIDAQSGERRLLTQGHDGGLKTHPHGSFTPDSRAIVFNSSRNGTADIFLVEVPEWEDLPAREDPPA